MPVEIRVPTLGESVVDATVAAWRKSEGEQVQQGEVLVELETDKVNLEVSAEQSGVLQQILKQAGETVGIGDVLAVIAEGAAPAAKPTSAQPSTPAAKQQPEGREVRPAASPRDNGESVVAPAASGEAPQATPVARKIAAEHHLDLSQVQADGPHGRLTKEDVLGYLEQHTQAPAAPSTTPAGWQPTLQAPAPAGETPALPQKGALQAPTQPTQVGLPAPLGALGMPSAGRLEERMRMSRRRQTIAQRLVQAQHTAAMLTTFNEIDMSAVMEVRKRRKDSFKERHGIGLGFMSFFTRAVVGALKEFPRLNAEIQGTEIVLKYYYDIGIAVGTEEGLVVPVVRDADRKTFAEIEREIADLAKRAREGALTLAELQGGTFTITNGGIYGSLMSTPILNAPQVGILGMHKIEERPVASNGQVVIRPMMYVALSYDHRIVDGSEAVRFLVRVKELVEDPEALLLEG
ncbi:MAG TPA: 2-oxoglutarate dehydrogenase complex dihydrolipoyllysine-residue succinyltransferase [Ktedonobacterales bacterium]|jgi:2-oxoglutarate dehydrogenase E2 component (dihydrolipoamide succinyltransferase)